MIIMTEDEINRNLFLFDMVDKKSTKEIVSQIYKINDYDDREEKIKKDYIREPIKLIIGSYGGYVDYKFVIISTIITSKTPVYTHIAGAAMSSSADIAMCGTYRTASKFANIMVHDMSAGAYGNASHIKDRTIEINNLRNMNIEFFKTYSKIPENIIDEIIINGRDIYLTADEALKYGIIDEIV